MEQLFGWLYAATVLLIGVFGFHMAVLLIAAIGSSHRDHAPRPRPLADDDLPRVLVQLPVYNERFVVERLIDAVAAFDYPRERLLIQVLDDSTDDTGALARTQVAEHAARGLAIRYCHRTTREGFKAGALAAGLALAPDAEFLAVFDADFVPPHDYLKRALACFTRPEIGLVQTRWDHLNSDQNITTMAQTLAFDAYFAVDQVARAQRGWLMNFNGSAGVWRRACIDDAGGWQGDTLAEDLDLSYRAQLKGWRLTYFSDIAPPAELPPTVLAFRQQQFRWAKGSFQVLGKLGWKLLWSQRPIHHKLLGFAHLNGYFPHVLMVASVLFSLPVVWYGGETPLHWGALGALALVPPLTVLWGQARLRQPWWRWLWAYPFMVLMMIGIGWSNTTAFFEALSRRQRPFMRTPKFSDRGASEVHYQVGIEGWMLGETFMAAYALLTAVIAWERAINMVPLLLIYALAFGSVAVSGWRDVLVTRRGVFEGARA
jgi:cellulose synthase/poly-beta-1,6-N-acetylglucosamine synthase-like glycosyltransferase